MDRVAYASEAKIEASHWWLVRRRRLLMPRAGHALAQFAAARLPRSDTNISPQHSQSEAA